jgi:hypothetical protein
MIDKASGREYLNLAFSRGFVATAWTTDVDYKVMNDSFVAYRIVLSHQAPPSGEIGAKCAADWPDDYRMQEYCVKTQRESSDALDARSMTGSREQGIRAKCQKDWSDDYKMRNYCEEQQLKSLRAIGGGV